MCACVCYRERGGGKHSFTDMNINKPPYLYLDVVMSSVPWFNRPSILIFRHAVKSGAGNEYNMYGNLSKARWTVVPISV